MRHQRNVVRARRFAKKYDWHTGLFLYGVYTIRRCGKRCNPTKGASVDAYAASYYVRLHHADVLEMFYEAPVELHAPSLQHIDHSFPLRPGNVGGLHLLWQPAHRAFDFRCKFFMHREEYRIFLLQAPLTLKNLSLCEWPIDKLSINKIVSGGSFFRVAVSSLFE